MVWVPPPTGKQGRQPQYSDAAIQTCLTLKVLFGMALRQTMGFVESLLRLVGLDWAVPDYSTLSRRQKTLAVNIPYRGSKGPLHLLIDSTGIKAEGAHSGAFGQRFRRHPVSHSDASGHRIASPLSLVSSCQPRGFASISEAASWPVLLRIEDPSRSSR
jgi:hypothetical protein